METTKEILICLHDEERKIDTLSMSKCEDILKSEKFLEKLKLLNAMIW